MVLGAQSWGREAWGGGGGRRRKGSEAQPPQSWPHEHPLCLPLFTKPKKVMMVFLPLFKKTTESKQTEKGNSPPVAFARNKRKKQSPVMLWAALLLGQGLEGEERALLVKLKASASPSHGPARRASASLLQPFPIRGLTTPF